jgi:HK97 family phage prohead protease
VQQLEFRDLSVFTDSPDELRVAPDEGAPNRLVGYAAVFGSLSADLGGFKERIRPGAFKNSITSNVDIRALAHHDPTKILGRTSNGTLRLSEDARGLRVEIDLPEGVSYANDIRSLVQRGDIRGMSFGFKVPKGGHSFSREGGQSIRDLHNVDLREVTITSVPAYGDTSLSLRVDPSVLIELKKSSNLEMAKRRLRLLSIP